ncbi:hypothetical protein GCM10009117_12110 [Gangjinia marincola]|uniref:Uncharacterized protein n=2 Tax=Gangjinia marincola TaxID=578463 RepID=A0ABP3XW28_9FLAO
MKIIAIAQGAWLLPNLIIAAPFLILAALGWRLNKQKNYSWLYVIAGVVVISLIRYYETEWMFWLNETFSS